MNWRYALEHSVDLREHIRDFPVDPTDSVVQPETFAECYMQGALGLHLHVAVARRAVGDIDVREFCADLERLSEIGAFRDSEDLASGVGPGDSSELILGGSDQHRIDVSVFVGVRQPTQDGQGVSLRKVPSLVRLVAPNDCLMYGLDARQPLGDQSVELLSSGADGKLYLRLLTGLQWKGRAVLGDLPGDMVKSAAEVVQSIPEDVTTERVRSDQFSDDDDDPVRLNVILQPKVEWFSLSVPEIGIDSLESCDMFPRPTQLPARAFQVGVRH